jgi:16S rRNA (cytosine967-C5)-methyltransferase
MVTSRILAYQILLHLEQKAPHPDRLIRSTLERHSRIDERDRALLTELVYGVLRWRARLDWHIDQLSKTRPDRISPDVRVLLRLALYQIMFLDRIPDHAAVNDAVEIAKGSCPPHVVRFINGLLREAARRTSGRQASGVCDFPALQAPSGNWKWPEQQKDPAHYMALMTSNPVWLVRRLIEEIGAQEARLFFEASNKIAPAAFRINTLKATREEAITCLQKEAIEAEASARLEGAIQVATPRRDMTDTVAFREGFLQPQDEGSQIVSLLVAPKAGERVLDLCSGLGVKSAHMAILMENEGEVLSVDQSAWKLEEARKNAQRQSITIIRTLAQDALALRPEECGLFDRVLLDAPCTGLGTLRRKPDIKWRRHIKDVYRLSQVQKELLEHAARFLKPGGLLVYATCTVFGEENESVAQSLTQNSELSVEPAFDRLPPLCREMSSGPYYRCWPHRHAADGFFSALWRR